MSIITKICINYYPIKIMEIEILGIERFPQINSNQPLYRVDHNNAMSTTYKEDYLSSEHTW